MTTAQVLIKKIALYLVENDPNPTPSIGADRSSRTFNVQRNINYRRKLCASFYDSDSKGVDHASTQSYVSLDLVTQTKDQFGFVIVDYGLRGELDDDAIFRITGINPIGLGYEDFIQLSNHDWTGEQREYFQSKYNQIIAWFYRELIRKQRR